MSETRMLYSYPGPHQIDGDGYDYKIVEEEDVEKYLDAGYTKTTTEAKANYIEEFGEEDEAETESQDVDINKLREEIRAELKEEYFEKVEIETIAATPLSDEDIRFNALVVVLDDINADSVEFVADRLEIEYTNKEDTIIEIKIFLGIEN